MKFALNFEVSCLHLKIFRTFAKMWESLFASIFFYLYLPHLNWSKGMYQTAFIRSFKELITLTNFAIQLIHLLQDLIHPFRFYISVYN